VFYKKRHTVTRALLTSRQSNEM